jgi:sugar phosphate isomerase/epimerase
MFYTRRDFGKLALSALPAASPLAAVLESARQPPKPDSRFAGVHIGINAPYSFRGLPGGPDDILKYCRELGVSALELRSQPVETFLGVPAHLAGGRGGGRRGRGAGQAGGERGRGRAALTPEEQAAQRARAEELLKWRLGVSMDRVREFRRKYEDAGVFIEIVKFDGIYALPDEGIDYSFNLAKALGARAISCEISVPDTKRLGQFAEQHKLLVGYHGHASTTPADWETAFGYSKYNGANVDLGHFVAGNNTSPLEFITKYHDRIPHVHVKDRKRNNGANVRFGDGDTPIGEVLAAISKNKWQIQGTIEYEYPPPDGSDVMTELARCVQFCRNALT